jgi:xanthine dehydrogenase iron-sulfur cluster and FAD-binding subunit A
VKPPVFEYVAARSTEEALAELARHGEDAKLLAGGQSLMPILNMRLAAPRRLVDLNRVVELAYVEERDGGVAIGAMTRQRAVEKSALVSRRVPLLAEAIPWVGHFQIRNRGTIGGSLAHADPAAELPAVAACLDARFTVRGPAGTRTLTADELYVTYLTTSLAPTEILTGTWWPAAPADTGYAWLELARRHGDYALVGVAAAVTLRDGAVAEARLALTGVGGRPVRAREAERALASGPLSDAALDAAAAAVRRAIAPEGDIHATAEYRRHIAGVLVVRALRLAAERALLGGGRRPPSEPPLGIAPAKPALDQSVCMRGPGESRESLGSPCSGAPRRGGASEAGARTADPHTREEGRRVSVPAEVAVTVTVNGRAYSERVAPRLLLSDFLRHRLGLTGTHVGCEHGVCGACTVLVDGAAVRSCLLLAVQADGAAITTVEGLAPDGERLHPIQQAFHEMHGLQCGFCTPGILLSVVELLRDTSNPDDAAIRQGLAGTLCRCTGYQNIVRAVRRAAELGGR